MAGLFHSLLSTVIFSTIMAPFTFMVALTDSFSHLYIAILLLTMLIVFSLFYTFSKNKALAMKMLIIFTTIFSVLFWLSFTLSTKSLPVEYSANGPNYNKTMALSGFPFHTFNLPFAPMGNDLVPQESWPPFYLNYLVYFILALVMTGIINFKHNQVKFLTFFSSRKAMAVAIFILLWINIVETILIVLKFD